MFVELASVAFPAKCSGRVQPLQMAYSSRISHFLVWGRPVFRIPPSRALMSWMSFMEVPLGDVGASWQNERHETGGVGENVAFAECETPVKWRWSSSRPLLYKRYVWPKKPQRPYWPIRGALCNPTSLRRPLLTYLLAGWGRSRKSSRSKVRKWPGRPQNANLDGLLQSAINGRNIHRGLAGRPQAGSYISLRTG